MNKKPQIFISNLFTMGLHTQKLKHLPLEYGVEVFIECGHDYYWDKLLPRLIHNRTGGLSVHGPFQNIDLADVTADFEEIKAVFAWAFEKCAKFGAAHCVAHPHGHGVYPDIDAARACARDRLVELSAMAKSVGVELLVENMPEKDGIFNQQAFFEWLVVEPTLSFLIDIGHTNTQNWDVPSVLEQLGSRIRGYHLSDNFGDFDSHLAVGEGNIDWQSFYQAFARYTPDAALVCEYDAGTVESVLASAKEVEQGILACYA